jgi:hypothetical protein
MDPTPALKALPIAVVIGVTPLAIKLLGRLFPPSRGSAFDERDPLDRHNGWINAIAGLLCLGAFFLPFFLFWREFDRVGWPALGLMFGGAAILPNAWICLATLPFGLDRFHSYWRDSERKLGIGLLGIGFLYVPLALIGLASVIELSRSGVW